MGCCLSKSKGSASSKKRGHASDEVHGETRNLPSYSDRGPPPLEEEIVSVKEVLSETPISKPSTVEVQIDRIEEAKSEVEGEGESKTESRSVITRAEDASELSQPSLSLASEFDSVSESLDTAGFGDGEEVASKGDCGGGARRKAVRGRTLRGEASGEKETRVRSPGVRRPVPSPEKRNRTAAPSPDKRAHSAAPSPDRRNRAAVPSPDSKSRTAAQKAARQRSASPAESRRDISGQRGVPRRSRSPAARVDGGASCAVARTSAAAAETAPGVVDGPAAEGKREGVETEERGDFPMSGESLDNPQVSLECFIFL